MKKFKSPSRCHPTFSRVPPHSHRTNPNNPPKQHSARTDQVCIVTDGDSIMHPSSMSPSGIAKSFLPSMSPSGTIKSFLPWHQPKVADDEDDGDDDTKDVQNDAGVDEVDSEDVPQFPNGLWQQLWSRMNPAVCLAPDTACTGTVLGDATAIDLDREVPKLLRDLKQPGNERTEALQRLYKLSDRQRKNNRYVRIGKPLGDCSTTKTSIVLTVKLTVPTLHSVPIVAVVNSEQESVFQGLQPCLSPLASEADRRQALLLLNNLCIPMQNKAFILLGDQADTVLSSLMIILQNKLPEAYLAAACLFNLSYLPDAKKMLFYYAPVVAPENMRSRNRFDRGDSTEQGAQATQSLILFRVVEEMCNAYAPALEKKEHSADTEAIRWSIAFVRNLATEAVLGSTIAHDSVFPTLAVQYLKSHAPEDMARWTQHSMPDVCLSLIWHLVVFEDCLEPLLAQDTQDALLTLQGRGGIHEMWARAVLNKLQAEENAFQKVVVDDDP